MTTDKIPTAEELTIKAFVRHPDSYSHFNRVSFTGKQLKQIAVEFAKLHVQAALKAANDSQVAVEYRGQIEIPEILNAYDLNNIQ